MGPSQPQGSREEVLSSRTPCPVRFEEAGAPKETTEKDQPNLYLEPTGNLDVLGDREGGITQGKATESSGKGGGWLWRGSLNALMPGTWHLATIYL